MQIRRHSPILTYSKQEDRLATHAVINKRHRQEDWRFFWKVAAFASFVLAGCLYVTLEPIQAGDTLLHTSSVANSVGSLLLRGRRSERKRLLYAAPPPLQYERTMWTMDEFWVLDGNRGTTNSGGVNLAQFGFELTTDHPSTAWIEEPFGLYTDFDVSSFVEEIASESSPAAMESTDSHDISRNTNINNKNLKVYDLLQEHRHLDHPSLAFYIDKIAQKRYLQAHMVPVPSPIACKYKDEILEMSQEEDIQKLFPNQTDFAVKPSHRNGYTKLVEYDPEAFKYSAGSSPHYASQMDQDYNPSSIANTLTHTLDHGAKVHRMDPWSIHYVTPGVIVEERMTSVFDSNQPPVQLNVYVIWGRVWMASWSNYNDDDNNNSAEEPSNPAVVYRNGTVVVVLKDGDQQYMLREVPDWLPWGRVVQVAEGLAAHKDIYQVNLLVGISAATARNHRTERLSRDERLDDLQVVVVDTRLDPVMSKLPDRDGLVQEFGRLWMAGYHMGIYKTVPNTEVPSLFHLHHRLTESDAMWINVEENLTDMIQRAIYKKISHGKKFARRARRYAFNWLKKA